MKELKQKLNEVLELEVKAIGNNEEVYRRLMLLPQTAKALLVAIEALEFYADIDVYAIGSGKPINRIEFGEDTEEYTYEIFDDSGEYSQQTLKQIEEIMGEG